MYSIGLLISNINFKIRKAQYFLNAVKRFPKESIEGFVVDAVLQLVNYRVAWQGFSKNDPRVPNKGQDDCVKPVLDAIREGHELPI